MSVTAECFVQIEGEVRGGSVWGAKVIGVTQNEPARPKPGTLTVKLRLKFPDGAFLRLIPTADVAIPDEWFTTTPVVVVSLPPAGELEEGEGE